MEDFETGQVGSATQTQAVPDAGESGGGSVLHLAVVLGLASLSVCYVAGVNGNWALLIFLGVVVFVLMAGAFILFSAAIRAENKAVKASKQADQRILLKKIPQEYSEQILLGDSLVLKLSIEGSPQASKDPRKLGFENQ